MTDQPGLGDLLRQAQQMQEQLTSAQANAAAEIVEGSAGGGAVKVRVSGDMTFQSIEIDPSAVDAGDVAMLEDLVLAALHDAVGRVAELNQRTLGSAGLGGLGGLGSGPGGLLG